MDESKYRTRTNDGHKMSLSSSHSFLPSIVDYSISNFAVHLSSLELVSTAAGEHLYVMDVSISAVSTMK